MTARPILSCTSIVTGTSDIDDFGDRLIWELSPLSTTTVDKIGPDEKEALAAACGC